MADNDLKFLTVGEGADQRAIAVRQHSGAAPGLFWLGGRKYDTQGTQAQGLLGQGGRGGAHREAAHAGDSTMPDMANRAAHSPTERSVAGSAKPLPYSTPAAAGHKS